MKHRWMLAASVTALAGPLLAQAGTPSDTQAQTPATPPAVTDAAASTAQQDANEQPAEVVVTGQRAALTSAQNIRRQAPESDFNPLGDPSTIHVARKLL